MSHKKSKHIVELWGLPGVGKTTLTEKLVSKHRFTFIAARQMSWQKPRLMIRYPKVIFYWLRLIWRCHRKVKSFVLLRYNIALLLAALQRQYDAERATGDRLVIDEGLLQRLLSYSDVLLTTEEITRLVSLSPLGDMIVLVNHRTVQADRYAGQHVRNSLGDEYMSTWRNNMQINCETIRKALHNKPDVTLLETATDEIGSIINK